MASNIFLKLTDVEGESVPDDRFKLVVHTETRELPIYALVLARRDGKLGARIRPSTFDCLALRGNANANICMEMDHTQSVVARGVDS